MGRRRRRLYWTIGLLAAVALVSTLLGLRAYRAARPQAYRPGEENAEITRTLARDLPPEAPEPRFTDVTREAGLGEFRSFSGARTSQLPEDMGGGAAWGDFDRDGDDDLFLVSAGGALGQPPEQHAPSRLYENLGDGTFTEAPFPDTRIVGMGAAWGDYDGDGWLDLIVSGFDVLRLYHNDGGRLTRDPSFDERAGFWSGVSWSDYDRDGDLDLYVCGYVRYAGESAGSRRSTVQYGRAVPVSLNPAAFDPQPNLLLRNNGDGTFENVAEAVGVDNPEGRSLGALWLDLDDDGWLDLYVANDISDNALLRNREGAAFENVSYAAWVADYRGAMGLTAGDWNRDGDFDLFITHWVAQENALYDSLVAGEAPVAGNGATHDGPDNLRFMDVADQRGLGQIALQRVGWGVEFADFDSDGWLDLAVANGSTFETETQPPQLRPEPSFLLWNQQGAFFHDLAPLVPALAVPHVSRGLAVADYDLDGDLDLLIVDHDAGVRLLRNDMQGGNRIQVRLQPGAGRPVEGARIRAEAGGVTLLRALASVSYLSQSSRTIHIGLGTASRVDRLTVRWPTGERTTYDNLEANTIWEIAQDGSPPTAGATTAAAPAPLDERERRVRFWAAQRAAMRAMKVEGDLDTAIARFKEALALDPRHEDSLYYLGNCLAETGDVQGALAHFEELMRLNPMSHRAHKRWAVLRAMTARGPEDYAAAARVLERAIEINPEETGALHALAEVDLLRGRRAAARERLEWVVRTNPRSADGLFLLAYLTWKDGDAGGATALLQRAGAARGKDWKPEGTAAEGEVRQKMHNEATPLSEVVEAWDGTTDLEAAFHDLDRRLASHRLS